MMTNKSFRLVMFNYYSDKTCNYAPYVNNFHFEGDIKKLGFDKTPSVKLENLVNEMHIPDGHEVIVTIQVLPSKPFGDKKIVLVKPHIYDLVDPKELP